MVKRLILTLLGVIFMCINVNATYYTQLHTKVSQSSTGRGKVYASTTKQAPSNAQYKTQESLSDTIQTEKNKDFPTYFYAFAQSNDPQTYEFLGWSETDNIDDIISKDNPFEVVINTGQSPGPNNTVTRTLYAHFDEKVSCTITGQSTTNGTFTFSDGTRTVSGTQSITTKEIITFTAKPSAGYKVKAWYYIDAKGTKTYFAFDQTSQRRFKESVKVGVEFIQSDVPVFTIKGKNAIYTSLTAANTAATTGDIIVLVSSGTLQSGNYAIKSGVTLLIPFDEEYTCVKDNNITAVFRGQSRYLKPTVYNTLTMAEGAKLTVAGTLSVSAVMNAANGGSIYPCGGVTNTYGLINMNKGSEITLNSGSTTYVWGYIIGEGKINALSGSTLYEGFQITDFRGGTASKAMLGQPEKVFQISQYYVQNIEAPCTFHKGATEKIISVMHADGNHGTDEYFTPAITYIGENGLFTLQASDATLTKSYDPKRDRQVYNISGNALLGDIVFTIDEGELNSADYVLPLTNNMSITLEKGTLSVSNQNGIIIPADMELTIKEAATLSLGNGNMFVYSKKNWGKYACYYEINPLTYTPTQAYIRTYANMQDAKVDVQGTLQFTGTGNLYTTAEDACIICSEGPGKIVLKNGGGTLTETNQILQFIKDPNDPDDRGTRTEYITIPLLPAQLYNERNNDYTSTASATSPTTYYYVHGQWQTTPLPTNQKFGDINGNRKIDQLDIKALSDHLTGKINLPTNGPADVNNNGRITLLDLVKLISILTK